MIGAIKRKFLLLVFALSCTLSLQAQQGAKIWGYVRDSAANTAIEYASVSITERISGKVVNGSISDSTGHFAIDGVPAGIYVITADFVGYKRKHIDSVIIPSGKTTIPIGNILLSPAGRMLRDATITASAPIIENKIDKLIYNAANDITAQGGQALDILKKVPQVNVDINGNVELLGSSNIRFLINGKPSSVFGNSIADALGAIPASQIKSIEVVTSPGARYDAQGTGGIINIILKESKAHGFNGSINLSGGTRLQNGSANLNYKHNNWGLNAYFSGNAQLSSRTPSTQQRTAYGNGSDTTRLTQDGYTDFTRNGMQAGLSFDWDVTKRDNINTSFSFNRFATSSNAETDILQDTAQNAPSMSSRRLSESKFTTNSFDWSLNYHKAYKKEHEELNILYSASYGLPVSSYQQSSIYTQAPAPYSGAQSSNPGTDNAHYLSADYTLPIGNATLEAGTKVTYQHISSNTTVDLLQPNTGEYYRDPNQSYSLQYNMLVYATYLSASFRITDKLKAKTGLRYEHTYTSIDYPGSTIPAYGTLVPSATLSYDLPNNSFVKLAYSRRLERADYRDLNPFVNSADPYNLSTGNPSLKPEIGNNTELAFNRSFGKAGNLYVALIERINTQDHKQVTLFYPYYYTADTVYTNVSVISVQNIGTEYNSGINVSGSYNISDKLTLRGNIFFSHRHSVGLPPGSTGADGNRFRTNLNASYQFPRDLIAEAYGNYNAATNNIQGKTPQNITYTIACRKQFWHKNGSLGLTATNLLNQYTNQVTTVTTAGYYSYSVRRLPYQSFGISFTYKFGKMTFKKKEGENYLNDAPTMGG